MLSRQPHAVGIPIRLIRPRPHVRALATALLASLVATACRRAPPAPPPGPETEVASPLAGVEVVGSARCQPCHPLQHEEWAASAHGTTLRKATADDEDFLASLASCSDMDVTHVLGKRHEIRFLVEKPDVPWGEGRWLALPCSWRVHDRAPATHHLEDWRQLPFEASCAPCHVTGARSDLSFLEPSVGCESCHGPGGRHVAAPSRDNIVTFRGEAAEEVTACASCHLQGGRSVRTGRPFPDAFVPGGSLFHDYRFDWAELDAQDPAQAIDIHQKILVRRVVHGGDASLRCTSCHDLHAMGHEEHAALPRQDYCFTCHESDMKLKEYSQSCNVCEF